MSLLLWLELFPHAYPPSCLDAPTLGDTQVSWKEVLTAQWGHKSVALVQQDRCPCAEEARCPPSSILQRRQEGGHPSQERPYDKPNMWEPCACTSCSNLEEEILLFQPHHLP